MLHHCHFEQRVWNAPERDGFEKFFGGLCNPPAGLGCDLEVRAEPQAVTEGSEEFYGMKVAKFSPGGTGAGGGQRGQGGLPAEPQCGEAALRGAARGRAYH